MPLPEAKVLQCHRIKSESRQNIRLGCRFILPSDLLGRKPILFGSEDYRARQEMGRDHPGWAGMVGESGEELLRPRVSVSPESWQQVWLRGTLRQRAARRLLRPPGWRRRTASQFLR